jgi:hypothetical protein
MPVPTAAAIYCLSATALSIALVVLLHFLEPEYDPSWRMLSEYSLGRYGALMRVVFVLWGSGVVALAVALGRPAWPGSLGLVLVAVGPTGAAFIDTDPVTTPHGEMSRKSNVHAVLGALFILGFPLAATVAGISVAGNAALGTVLAWASLAPWGALAWFLGSNLRYARSHDRGGPQVRVGWPNRVSMLVYLGWVALAAITVLH